MKQKMADLPETRLHQTPPFYHCGIDVFGPFYIKDGKETRGKSGTRKLWVLIFSCLYSRAIHMEPLDHMDTASFKMVSLGLAVSIRNAYTSILQSKQKRQ